MPETPKPDDSPKLPGWAWPTQATKALHYFPAEGEASLCRRYFAQVVELFDFPGASVTPTWANTCAACWRKAPRNGA